MLKDFSHSIFRLRGSVGGGGGVIFKIIGPSESEGLKLISLCGFLLLIQVYFSCKLFIFSFEVRIKLRYFEKPWHFI